MNLRPYQQAAVDVVYSHLRSKDNNPCVVLPTGTGKSVVIAKIVSDAVQNWHGRVLILAHVKELLEQNAGKVKAFCPEIPIGIFSAGLKSRDTEEPVIVAGIQSVYNKACDLGAFDLIIVDEAHLIAPDGDGMYRTFLKDMKVVNPRVRVIGLTATPFRLKGGLICQPENILNEICYEAGLKEMIAQGYLAPLVSRAGRVEADLDNLHVRGGEFIGDEMEAAMNNEAIVCAACHEIVELTKDRKSVLIFSTSVSHCKHIAEKIEAYSGMECAIVTGETSDYERAEILARFKGESVPADLFGKVKPPLKFLANVNVLTTGFDAVNTDCVVLLRPTNSAGLLIQMVGRGTRLSPATDKTNCIAEGTPILTNVGLVPIEKITKDMLLWDGIEFVPHDGIIYKGIQNVITYAGLTATPDHKVYYQHHWRTFQASAERNAPICVAEHNGMPIRETDGCFRRGYNDCGRRNRTEAYFCSDSMPMRNNRMEKLEQCKEKNCGVSCLRQTSENTAVASSTGNRGKEQMRESSRPSIPELWGKRNSFYVPNSDGYGTVCDEKLQTRQKDANRSNQQQLGLCTGKHSIDNKQHQSNEHPSSKQNQDVAISYEVSGHSVCRCHALQIFQQKNDGGGNNPEVLSEVEQTQRPVWDILNAGPRHRFTAAGLLVSNCLVLDYGGNILRHGPVDMIRVKEPGSGKGDAPAKKCPKCLALIHAAYAKCPECGYEFPPSEKSNLSRSASSAGIISGQTEYNDFAVQSVYYAVHEKRYAAPGTPRTMRIDYQVGFDQFKSEWVCPEHTGYAREKFAKWWRERAAVGCPIPSTAKEAVTLANQGLLAEPTSIKVKTVAGEKFERITGWQLKPRPVMREPGDDSAAIAAESTSAGQAATWNVSDMDDEIPF